MPLKNIKNLNYHNKSAFDKFFTIKNRLFTADLQTAFETLP